jgi:hypothetical protein
MTSSEAGMQIDRSDQHCSNANSPRAVILQPGSKTTLERLLQWPKQALEIVRIDGGREIISRDTHS